MYSKQNFINTLENNENILLYINNENLVALKKELRVYCKNHNIKYVIKDYCNLSSRLYNPTMYYINMEYNTSNNMRLLNAFTEKRIDKVFAIRNDRLEHLLG